MAIIPWPYVYYPQKYRGQVCGRSARGHIYTYWTREMPPLPLPFLECSVYFYRDKFDAEDGSKLGGSGFLALVPIEARPDGGTFYLVTNRHVAQKATVVRLNTLDDEFDVLPIKGDAWTCHKQADLAVAEISLPEPYRVSAVPLRFFLAEHDRDWYAVGTETASVGRFVKHDGKQQNTPAVRFGNVAMLPKEPIALEDGSTQSPAFLVESRSIPGYSGSPVFVYFPHPRTKPVQEGRAPIAGLSIRFLGITGGHIRDSVPLSTGPTALLNTGMSWVIPAWRLAELLNYERVAEMREEGEDQFKKENPDPPSGAQDFAEGESDDDRDYTREDFLRDLGRASRRDEKPQQGKE